MNVVKEIMTLKNTLLEFIEHCRVEVCFLVNLTPHVFTCEVPCAYTARPRSSRI